MIKKTTLALLLILTSIYSYGQESSIELPLIGDRLSGAVSETEEEALGRQFLRDLKRESAILYDPIVQEWTELFIYKIGEKSKVNKKAFELLIIEDNNLNAFAAPGGIIGVNAGLFKYSDNEAQFASVIAHELAHLSQRHFARQILEGSDRSNQSLATVLASILVAVATNSPAAVIGGQGILAAQQLRFKVFYKESLIGVPGLFKCWKKGNVGIVNGIGTGIADDKAIYSYVNKMIVYYLGEQPKLNQVETFLCHEKKDRDYVIENISKLVVKPANASGGYGILIGAKASKKEKNEMIEKIKSKPREFIAQPLEILSTLPTITENNIEPRHVDLRPFVLSGKSTYVTSGGLTRVALRKGSTIVNSSQGGGSKDTMIVDV